MVATVLTVLHVSHISHVPSCSWIVSIFSSIHLEHVSRYGMCSRKITIQNPPPSGSTNSRTFCDSLHLSIRQLIISCNRSHFVTLSFLSRVTIMFVRSSLEVALNNAFINSSNILLSGRRPSLLLVSSENVTRGVLGFFTHALSRVTRPLVFAIARLYARAFATHIGSTGMVVLSRCVTGLLFYYATAQSAIAVCTDCRYIYAQIPLIAVFFNENINHLLISIFST
jgi:hypothetical protein